MTSLSIYTNTPNKQFVSKKGLVVATIFFSLRKVRVLQELELPRAHAFRWYLSLFFSAGYKKKSPSVRHLPLSVPDASFGGLCYGKIKRFVKKRSRAVSIDTHKIAKSAPGREIQ